MEGKVSKKVTERFLYTEMGIFDKLDILVGSKINRIITDTEDKSVIIYSTIKYELHHCQSDIESSCEDHFKLTLRNGNFINPNNDGYTISTLNLGDLLRPYMVIKGISFEVIDGIMNVKLNLLFHREDNDNNIHKLCYETHPIKDSFELEVTMNTISKE